MGTTHQRNQPVGRLMPDLNILHRFKRRRRCARLCFSLRGTGYSAHARAYPKRAHCRRVNGARQRLALADKRDIDCEVRLAVDEFFRAVERVNQKEQIAARGHKACCGGLFRKWNIYGLSQANDVKVYIFDRDGKLLKQVSPKGEGWDGNFNGNPYPASDYWFTIDYTEQGTSKQYKSHFSLKR